MSTDPTTAPPDFSAEIERLEAKFAAVPGGGTVFYGSSSIRLWPRLSLAFPAIDAENWGFGGARLADCAAYFERLIVPRAPRAIVLYAGDNDLYLGASPGAVHDALSRLLDLRDQHLGPIPLAFISLKPSPARTALTPAIIEANEWCRREIWSRAGAVWVEVFDEMMGEDGHPRPELYTADQLHLSRAGYALWTDVLRRDAPTIVTGGGGD